VGDLLWVGVATEDRAAAGKLVLEPMSGLELLGCSLRVDRGPFPPRSVNVQKRM
jgi:hypothetical protein